MLLQINTCDLDHISFELQEEKSKKVVAESIVRVDHHESNKILEYLNTFLKKHKQPTISKIQLIAKEGGSYTGIRIGTSICQALSLAWNVPFKVKKISA